MDDLPEAISRDLVAIARISAVPSLLKIICSQTGMGFAAVARVTDNNWTACAVQDDIQFGLAIGGQLDVNTTLCIEARAARQPVVFDCASGDPRYCDHPTPKLYRIESYISVPIVRVDGRYFGNLCAIDPQPHKVSDARTVAMFESFAALIAQQLEIEDLQMATEDALLNERSTAERREQFMAVLGHDLRNPLASLSAIGELLARRKAVPEFVQAGQRILATTRRMAELIQTLLDFARGRTGENLAVALEEAKDLEASLSHVVGELQQAHGNRRIVEEMQLREPVWCDTPRIQQMLSNLLGNALTHGAPDQPIVVKAWTNQGWFMVSVTNGGEPIAPSDIGKIFEPYWRPAQSRHQEAGLGLGLHICSLIVKSHGGTLQVSSTAALGTQFIARIPARPGMSAIA